jgi:hypothetical protein
MTSASGMETVAVMSHELPLAGISMANEQPEQVQENITKNYAECPGCHSQTLLFSRTIKTYCFRCGLPVTKLDANNMYYIAIIAK